MSVKKEGNNKGRFFYTCQRQLGDPGKCDFFLWESDAQVREEGALLQTNSRTEPSPAAPAGLGQSPGTPTPVRRQGQQPQTPTLLRGGTAGRVGGAARSRSRGTSLFDSDEMSTDEEMELDSILDKVEARREASPSPSPSARHRQGRYSAMAPPTGPPAAASPVKRTFREMEKETSSSAPPAVKRRGFGSGDSNLDLALDSDTERQMAEIADQTSFQAASQSQSQTQRGDISSRSRPDPFTTPTSKRTYDVLGGLATPLTGDREKGAGGEHHDTNKWLRTPASAVATTALTPTPARTVDVLGSAATSRSLSTRHVGGGPDDAEDFELTAEIMALLAGQPGITEQLRQSVRQALDRHALRALGVTRGRDMVRAGLRARDARIVELQARIAELQARVAALENRGRMDRQAAAARRGVSG